MIDPSAHRRYLFTMWDGAGNVIVELRLAAQLVRRAHAVTVLGPVSIEDKVRAAGCAFLPDHAMTPYASARDYPADELTWLLRHVWIGAASEHAQEVVETAAALQADVVVCDHMLFGAMVGAEASGRPSVALSPELFAGSSVASLPPDHPRRRFWDWGLEPINAARRRFGLPPLTSVPDQWDALDRHLVLSIPELLDDTASLPANVRYVGPPLEEPLAAGAEKEAGTPPGVLISFSTSEQGQRAVVQTVVDGVAGLPVEGIVTLGYAMAGHQLQLPGNVTAVTYLPHATLLPRMDVVVTHAGHGTMMAALAYGVPLVCMPMGRDQHHNAARVAAVGAGVVIEAGSSASEVAEAIERVVHTPSYKNSAARLRAAIDASAKRAAGVVELEQLGLPPSPDRLAREGAGGRGSR